MKLTPKQKAFADFYIETGNATESAKRAGYSEKTAKVIACENLTKPYVREYVDSMLKEIGNQRIMNAEEVMTLLTSIARNQEREEVVVFSESGPQVTSKGMSAKDRLKALELIGKRYTLWTDKQQIEGSLGVTIVDDIE